MRRRHKTSAIAGLLMCLLFELAVCRAQPSTTLSEDDQFRVRGMLRTAYDDVKKYYYDPGLHGLDWEARFREYTAMIGRAHNMDNGLSVIAAFLTGLEDSHTYFVPPARAYRFDSGYRFALVGDACFITQIRPDTDAATKLHVGDQVVLLNGFNVNREDFHDVQYFFNILTPRATEQLELRSPAGEQRRVFVNSKIKANTQISDDTTHTDYWEKVRRYEDESHATRSRVVQYEDTAIWKLQYFNLDMDEVRRNINIARKHKALILDLRGNPGGAIDSLKSMVSGLFDHDVKLYDRADRKESKPVIARHSGKPFQGKLIVLVDAASGSCAELLARLVQIEHRGTVIGDKTAGTVMESIIYRESQGNRTRIFYGFSVTDANLIMSDGKSLEKTGVVPDEVLLPTGADLAADRDPVLTRAAELAGLKLDPVEAGKLFPFEWPPL
jgi:carboxyl-terminal processing protease